MQLQHASAETNTVGFVPSRKIQTASSKLWEAEQLAAGHYGHPVFCPDLSLHHLRGAAGVWGGPPGPEGEHERPITTTSRPRRALHRPLSPGWPSGNRECQGFRWQQVESTC